MRSLNEIRAQIETETSRAYHLKTKPAKLKAYDKIRALRAEALEILYHQAAKFGPQAMRCVVKTFNKYDERFLVDTPHGLMWLSPTSDVVSKSWYEHTCCVKYTIGQEIILDFTTEVNDDKLRLEIITGQITGGVIDEAQFAEMDKRDDLAFFKHTGSDGVCGLFK